MDLQSALLDLYDCDFDIVFEDGGALSSSNESCSFLKVGAIVDSLKTIPRSECKKCSLRTDVSDTAQQSNTTQVTVVLKGKCFFSLFRFFVRKNVEV